MNSNDNQTTSSAQNAQIKAALLAGARLTPIDALNRYGCFRLGARIWDLRHKQGMPIKSETVTLANGKRVASYFIDNHSSDSE